jgi:hypothetical protein
MDTRFDDLLNTVIAEKGQGIYGFFDIMFSFLYRRTDFFYEMAPGENMGFFPTQAEAIVCGYFRKYQQLHYKERVPKRNIDPKLIEQYIKKQKDNNEKKEEVKKIISNPQNEIKVENNNNNENKQEKKENVKENNNNNINVNSEKKEEKNDIKNLNENKKKMK